MNSNVIDIRLYPEMGCSDCYPEMGCSDCYHCPLAVREYDSDFNEVIVIGCMIKKEVLRDGKEADRL